MDHTMESKKSLNLDGIRTHDVRIISMVALPLRGLTGPNLVAGSKNVYRGEERAAYPSLPSFSLLTLFVPCIIQ